MLIASGQGDIDALRASIPHDPDVYYGFCREADGDRSYYAQISYLPEAVSGVQRGRCPWPVCDCIAYLIIHTVRAQPGRSSILELLRHCSRFVVLRTCVICQDRNLDFAGAERQSERR